LADAGGARPPIPELGRQPGAQKRGLDAGSAVAELRLPLFPPGPGDLEAWQRVLEIDPTLEPALRGMADGLAAGLDPMHNRTGRLRVLGNGVVPLEAAYAFVSLAACLVTGGEDMV